VTPRELEEARGELRRRRKAILEATRDAGREHAALLAAERGHELEEEAQAEQGLVDLERLGEAERLELRRIDAAMERIEEGRYGTCATCGAAIAARRLEALPWAVRCAGCEEVREAVGGRPTRSSSP
jgi:RNA polymerase-binding transcription factor DksA